MVLELCLPGQPFVDIDPSRHSQSFQSRQLPSSTSNLHHGYLTASWWSHLGEFMSEFQISLKIPTQLTLPPLRANDHFLMEEFCRAGY